MNKNLLLIPFMLATATAAHAGMQSTCSHHGQVRVIEVVYPQGGLLPCEVVYHKGNHSSVLWSAQNETGYCEQKAEEFTRKQQGWGWHCETRMSEISADDIQPDPMPAAGAGKPDAVQETAGAAE